LPKFGSRGKQKPTDTRWVIIGFLPCAAVHFLRSAFLAVVVACSCSFVQAAETTLVVTKAGYFLLVQDADGVPSLVKITNVIRLGDAPPTDPPTDPTDPPADVLRAAVKAATEAVTDPNKDRTKIALAKLYRTTGGLPVTSADQLKEATRVIFNALQLPAPWSAWKATTDGAADSFAAGDVDKIRAAWVIIAEVLEAM